MTHSKFFTLALALLFLIEAKAGCSIENKVLLRALTKESNFVNYLCPDTSASCSDEHLARKVEISAIELRQRNNRSDTEGAINCMITPALKGKQFPTLIYELTDTKAALLVEDWEAGLSPVQGVWRRGFAVLQGKAEPERGNVELYRLERKGNHYVEYQRQCYKTDMETGNIERKKKCH